MNILSKENFKFKKKTLLDCKILSVQSPSPINKSNSVPYCNKIALNNFFSLLRCLVKSAAQKLKSATIL